MREVGPQVRVRGAHAAAHTSMCRAQGPARRPRHARGPGARGLCAAAAWAGRREGPARGGQGPGPRHALPPRTVGCSRLRGGRAAAAYTQHTRQPLPQGPRREGRAPGLARGPRHALPPRGRLRGGRAAAAHTPTNAARAARRPGALQGPSRRGLAPGLARGRSRRA